MIFFLKASFLGHHRLVNDEFMLRVLDSMSFHKFIEEHGPPFQSCDIFDEVYATIYDQLKRKIDPIINNSSIAVLEHIKELANQLSLNKNPLTQQTYIQKVSQPSQTSCIRDNITEFPHLDKDIVNTAIKEEIKKQQNSRPYSARRLEILKQCVG
ncbi:unnamed protein product, partial [Rotaria sordida]